MLVYLCALFILILKMVLILKNEESTKIKIQYADNGRKMLKKNMLSDYL